MCMGWTPEFAILASEGNLTVGIIGLGYVGLPTAIGFHDAGFNVWGVDISQRTVDMVKRGENPTGDPDVDDIISEVPVSPAPVAEMFSPGKPVAGSPLKLNLSPEQEASMQPQQQFVEAHKPGDAAKKPGGPGSSPGGPPATGVQAVRHRAGRHKPS